MSIWFTRRRRRRNKERLEKEKTPNHEIVVNIYAASIKEAKYKRDPILLTVYNMQDLTP